MDFVTLALLGLGFVLSKGKKTADKLEYYPKNLELIKGKLVFTMEILNPTTNKLKVDSVFAGIFAGKKKIGNIERGESFTLAPKKRTSVSFPVKLNALGIAQVLPELIRGKGFDVKFSVKGVARALGIDSPIDDELSFLK